MALKGLVRFFAIMLILISVWQLSFTWIVNNFESKQKARAEKFVKNNFGTASKETKDSATNAVYRRYIDSLKEKEILDIPLLYSKLTYQRATERELNLGLDLQGGMNVTLEVGLDGLIRSMSNNPKDPTLNKALASAIQKKANSDADFVTLFGQAYDEASLKGRLAPLFAGGKNKTIKIDANNSTVIEAIRIEARDAIKRTYDRLMARIDQFGVAQPSVSYDENKGIITVELAGIDDPERVRKFLQATANLEFWDTYTNADPVIGQSFQQMDQKVKAYLSGNTDTTKAADTSKLPAGGDNPVTSLISFNQPDGSAMVGLIRVSDTAIFSKYRNLDIVKSSIPSTLRFLYGAKAETKNKNGESLLPIYSVKTVPGSDEPKLTGEFITDARQDFDQRNNEVQVQMEMNTRGAAIWEKMTGDAFNGKYAIAIALDNYVYSAPGVNNGAISGGVSQISGNFSIQEAQDLASVLRTGKLPAPARIVAEQVVGPTLGAEAVRGGSLSFIISFIVIFILMLVYYNSGGWVANIALILNLLFTVGVLSMYGATLTAAGIAGLVLTIGMAVDTNVIIFERIKEELTKGKSYQMAVEDGYRRSLAPVLDGH
nr:protein translocase subunit SecD [Lacibacter sp.]